MDFSRKSRRAGSSFKRFEPGRRKNRRSRMRTAEDFMQLVPHLLLRTDSGISQLAMALRDAGYLVTKAADDDSAIRLAEALNVDGIVAELSSFAAVRFARCVSENASSNIPVVLVTSSPKAVRKSEGVYVLHAASNDLVSEIDLTLARAERRRRIAI